MKNNSPYFYYQNTHHMVPFGRPGVAIRAPTKREEDYLKDDPDNNSRGDNGVSLTLEDNGDSGDGMILTVSTEVSSSDDPPLFWGALSIRGAMALHEALGNLLRMRQIELQKDGGK